MEILSLSLALAFPTLEAAASYLPGRTFLRTACVAGVILVVGQGLAPASVRSTAPFVAVYYFLLWLFPRLLPRSFTFGESSLLIQGAVILVFVIHRLGNEFDEESFLSFYAIRAVLLAGLATSPVLALGRTPTAVAPSSNATIPGSAFYITALLVVFFFLVLPLWGKLKPDPISWAVQFVLVSATRPSLVCYWVLSLGTIAAVYSWLASGAATKAMLNLKRKYYHLLATAMFWPAAILDPNLLFVAFAAAFALFLLLEYLRIGRIWPAGEVLDAFLKSFLDERDSGLMIVSHTYLLLGCSIPLWLAKARDFRGLGGFAGILTLGIADTAVSAAA
ncbi:hypothetical protein DFJ74DRAFT_114087 [Hyaloraphidium curvatum]|nr:hypothetical protein DFJ74DRAFT_114087 [Hyaloraphidium curvatum]